MCRELTKLHEEVLRAPAPELARTVRERGEMRGEMALVVAPPSPDELARYATGAVGVADRDPDEALREDIEAALAAGEAPSAAAKRLSQKYSLKKRAVYERVLAVAAERDT